MEPKGNKHSVFVHLPRERECVLAVVCILTISDFIDMAELYLCGIWAGTSPMKSTLKKGK